MADKQRRVYLIDASIYIFRAWFSLPDSLTNAEGNPINALHGFADFLGGFLDEARPEHVAVVFDESLTSSFRNQIFPAYKANRELPPAELKQQFNYCRTLVNTLGLADFSSNCYEADDLIGTIAARLRRQDFSMVILSADKDLAQLIEEGDMLWDYARKRRHRYADIPQWLGVQAHQVADWLALAGDSVDNIPGVPGIGAKTATALLTHFESLENLYDRLDEVSNLKLRGAARIQGLLRKHEENARLARQLTGVAIDPDLQVGASDVERRAVSSADVTAVCDELGLGRMTQARLARVVG
ncbi:MAG: exodeoxyribonuclease IX [Gammaproteobacteria bacterium]|nr:exodeoxyribonuclease IX [Gammaproteobacteria bacterium]MDH3561239.1 exodeoxyribonuclease IX [Gammaproteobacteria bacterium]